MRQTDLFLLLAPVMLLVACTTTPVPSGRELSRSQLADQYVQLGVGYMKEGKYELATARLKRAAETDPKSAQAQNMLGLLYETLNQSEKAEAHYRKAVALDPELAPARNNYGTFLCNHGRSKEAEAEFKAALANPLYQNPEIAYTNAGLCLQRAGDLDRAEEYLRAALAKNPRMALALFNMSRISLETGHTLSARAYLQRYQEVAPVTAESLWLGYQVEKRLGDNDAASSYATRLEADFPDSQELRLLHKAQAP